jgi:hypothetical protein
MASRALRGSRCALGANEKTRRALLRRKAAPHTQKKTKKRPVDGHGVGIACSNTDGRRATERCGGHATSHNHNTTSQLVRSIFPTHPVMPNLVMPWEMSPLRAAAGRSAGGYQVVGAGPRPPELELGRNDVATRNWAQTEARGGGGLVGPRVRCGVRHGGQPRPLTLTTTY